MIEALETSQRAPIPYRWEQIGSKHLTSSRIQVWLAQRHAPVSMVICWREDVSALEPLVDVDVEPAKITHTPRKLANIRHAGGCPDAIDLDERAGTWLPAKGRSSGGQVAGTRCWGGC